jgi:hypothetical protein
MADQTDIALLQSSVEALATQTTDLLEQFTRVRDVTQQALAAASIGDSLYAMGAYESAQYAEAKLLEVNNVISIAVQSIRDLETSVNDALAQSISNVSLALQHAESAQASAQEIASIRESIIYWA